MEVITKEYKVFSFEELEEEDKQQIVEDYWDINTEYEDWYDIKYLKEKLKEYGIKTKDICFDFGRGSYLYLDESFITDERKFLKSMGVDLRTKDAKILLEEGISIDTDHFGGGCAKNSINTYYIRDLSRDDDLEEGLNEHIYSICKELATIIKEQYDYLTSREAIEETIISNEYQFVKDSGKYKIF